MAKKKKKVDPIHLRILKHPVASQAGMQGLNLVMGVIGILIANKIWDNMTAKKDNQS